MYMYNYEYYSMKITLNNTLLQRWKKVLLNFTVGNNYG